MAINWPDLNIPPINKQVLIPADQFYSERKPTKEDSSNESSV